MEYTRKYAQIYDGKIQNMIVCDDYEMANYLARAAYGSEAFALEAERYACGIGDKYEEGQFWRYNEKTEQWEVIPYIPTQEQQVEVLNSQVNNINQELHPTIDKETCTVDALKIWQINLSKTELAVYLQEHPLVSNCHRGKIGTYTITEEKRTMFTSKYTAHITLVTAGVEDQMTWNESGQPCEPWTDEECIQFIAEWNAVTTPLVSYQQSYEVQVKACVTKDEILAISLDYSIADPRNIITEQN